MRPDPDVKMKTEAVMKAYESLDFTDKYKVDKLAKKLRRAIKEKSPASKLSKEGMIELLGKIWILKLMFDKRGQNE